MTDINFNSLRKGPNSNGRFGIHGGRFVAETLMPLILDVETSYEAQLSDPVPKGISVPTMGPISCPEMW